MLLGLFANIPNLILSLPLFVLTAINVFTGACSNAVAVFNLIFRLHCSMYLGTILGMTGFNNDPNDPIQILVAALFVVVPLISAGVTHLAYWLGSHESKLLSFLSRNKRTDK